VSDDGAWSIVIIALLGNPFSPRYARARGASGRARALDYCAMNVALYGPRGSLWALREREIGDGHRGATEVAIGGSRMGWKGDALTVDIDETTSPLSRSVRGRITFHPEASPGAAFSLDEMGRHSWWPVAPGGRIEVALDEPSVRFSGHGYHDANSGDVPLEATFARWTWCRARASDRETRVTYDVTETTGKERNLSLDFDTRRGELQSTAPLRSSPLATTAWRIERQTRVDGAHLPRVARTLEDTPFYARALIDTAVRGRRVIGVHETLSLDRFSRDWVRFLLGFRMGRA
jgi:carotenoid 1,2-hydratase